MYFIPEDFGQAKQFNTVNLNLPNILWADCFAYIFRITKEFRPYVLVMLTDESEHSFYF